MATVGLTPLEEERSEFGYYIEQIRFKNLRLIRRAQTSSTGNDSDTCIFFVHGGGGRACQFKHQIRTLQEMLAQNHFLYTLSIDIKTWWNVLFLKY